MTHRFRVWAPAASSVEVVLGARRVGMRSAGAGWHEVTVEDAGPGTRYAYSLDGGPPRPDPRSPFQPEGVDGPSELVDHGAFDWPARAWRGSPLPGAVLYELHVGTFDPAGTFDGVRRRLGHLVELGVDAVELMPVAEFPGRRGWGYDGVDLYAPHHAYGGPDGLKRLVDACHGLGLAVVLDVVYNHLGPAGNYLPEFGPYFTDRYATPWGMAVNLDGPGSDEVRRFFLDNALMWLRDYHFDGLRIDAVHALLDTSATHLLEELAVEVERLAAQEGRSLLLIAESDLNDPRVVARREVGGYGIDAQWSDDFHHALHAVLTGEQSGYYADFGSLRDVATALEHVFVYAARHSAFRERRHGRSPAGIPGWRFCGYAQNHDQVGNRATGDRTSHLVGVERLEVAAALVLTSPFTPMLFMGEEWGASTRFPYFTDHPDPELGRAVSEGRRGEFASFGWRPEDVPDPQDEATFAQARLDWAECGRDSHRRLLEWHRSLLALRRSVPELRDGALGDVRAEVDDARGRLCVRRGQIAILVNLGGEPWRYEGGAAAVLLRSPAVAPGEPLVLPPDSVAVVRSR